MGRENYHAPAANGIRTQNLNFGLAESRVQSPFAAREQIEKRNDADSFCEPPVRS
jgi:hypothetical protein